MAQILVDKAKLLGAEVDMAKLLGAEVLELVEDKAKHIVEQSPPVLPARFLKSLTEKYLKSEGFIRVFG